MCRLYGFRSSTPTRVECELIDAQNSLIGQSERDARGLINDDGWGIGVVEGGRMSCEREVGPASESEEYRWHATSLEASTVVAHVRRATVGQPAVENTHPFRHGSSMLAHNGHLGDFELLRARIRDRMGEERAHAIQGSTDSEHLFQLLLSRRDARPDADPTDLLARTIRDVRAWNEEVAGQEEVAVNALWSVGPELYGSRLGRSLWYVERSGPHECEVCGRTHHREVPAGADYRAVVVASERITDEEWTEVPEGTVFRIGEDFRLEAEPLER